MAAVVGSAGSRGRGGALPVPGLLDAGDRRGLALLARVRAGLLGLRLWACALGERLALPVRCAVARDVRDACGDRRARRGAVRDVRHPRGRGAAEAARPAASAQGMLWPISFSISATALPSPGPTMVMAVPVLPARPVRPMRWT